MHRRELFPADRGLQARMVVAAVLTPLVVVAALAAAAKLAPIGVLAGIGLALVAGVVTVTRERRQIADGMPLAPEAAPGLFAALDRLCVVADLPRPEVALHGHREPNSWIVDALGKPPRLHVTRGLLELLEPDELEAVIAHELAHVAHRDATVMTVVGLPGALLAHGPTTWPGFWTLWLGTLLARGIAQVAGVGTTALSRYRELSADAGAAALTGRPMALASALRKIAGELRRIPSADLRERAALDLLHLLPVEREGRGPLGRLRATHPPLAQRIAALERLEREQHTARLG